MKKLDREQITVRLSTELKEQVQQKADERGISFNAALIIFLQKGICNQ